VRRQLGVGGLASHLIPASSRGGVQQRSVEQPNHDVYAALGLRPPMHAAPARTHFFFLRQVFLRPPVARRLCSESREIPAGACMRARSCTVPWRRCLAPSHPNDAMLHPICALPLPGKALPAPRRCTNCLHHKPPAEHTAPSTAPSHSPMVPQCQQVLPPTDKRARLVTRRRDRHCKHAPKPAPSPARTGTAMRSSSCQFQRVCVERLLQHRLWCIPHACRTQTSGGRRMLAGTQTR
jgi:hypothetical protein